MTYFWMLERDKGRFTDSLKRTEYLTIGCNSLKRYNISIDRHETKDLLGFASVYENSLDAVSDRDYIVETLHNISLTMVHLSRFAEIIFGQQMKQSSLHLRMHFNWFLYHATEKESRYG